MEEKNRTACNTKIAKEKYKKIELFANSVTMKKKIKNNTNNLFHNENYYFSPTTKNRYN